MLQHSQTKDRVAKAQKRRKQRAVAAAKMAQVQEADARRRQQEWKEAKLKEEHSRMEHAATVVQARVRGARARDQELGELIVMRAALVAILKGKEGVLGEREGRSEANWLLR